MKKVKDKRKLGSVLSFLSHSFYSALRFLISLIFKKTNKNMVIFWLTVVIFVLYIYMHFNEQSRLIDQMFPGPTRLPIIGTLPVNTFSPKNLANVGLSIMNKYGHKPFRVWYFNKPYIIIPDHQTAKIILSSSKFTEKADFYKALEPWFGKSHLIGSGQRWLQFRKHDANAFCSSALSSYINDWDKNCKILCQLIENSAGNDPFDVYKHIHRYSLDNLCVSIMGYEPQTQANPDSPYFQAIDKMVSVYFWSMILRMLKIPWAFYFTSLYWIQRKSGKILREFSKGIVDSKKELEIFKDQNLTPEEDDENNNNGSKRGYDNSVDVITNYVLSKKFTDEEIQIEIEMAISAGHGTITSGLCFIFYMMSKYPDAQTKVYEEVLSVLPDSDTCPTAEHLAEMKYMEQVIKETLRVFTAVPVIGRHVKEDVRLNEKQFIPKGTDVLLALSFLHRDPSVWPNPGVFDPDRFSPENVKKRDPYAYIPWSAGPRGCLGYRYAITEFKVTIARIIRQFKLSLSDNPEDKLKLTMNILLTSVNGFKFKFDKRN